MHPFRTGRDGNSPGTLCSFLQSTGPWRLKSDSHKLRYPLRDVGLCQVGLVPAVPVLICSQGSSWLSGPEKSQATATGGRGQAGTGSGSVSPAVLQSVQLLSFDVLLGHRTRTCILPVSGGTGTAPLAHFCGAGQEGFLEGAAR